MEEEKMENNTFENYSAPEANGFQDTFTANEQPAKTGNIIDKIKAMPKQMLIKIGAAVAALILVIVLLCTMGNNFKTPIKAMEKLQNSKSYSKVLKMGPKMLNGYGESEAKKALKIFKKSDVYKDNIDDEKDDFKESIEFLEDELGKNYKFKYKVDGKDKLDKDDLKDYKDSVKSSANYYLERLNEADAEDLADELGISKAKAKKLIKLGKKFFKDAKSAKVSAGYEVDITYIVKGKELDEPKETTQTVYVYKVNGKWTLDFDTLMSLDGVFDFMSYL
jgi:hypothetical protein